MTSQETTHDYGRSSGSPQFASLAPRASAPAQRISTLEYPHGADQCRAFGLTYTDSLSRDVGDCRETAHIIWRGNALVVWLLIRECNGKVHESETAARILEWEGWVRDPVICNSGQPGERSRLQLRYSSFEEWQAYSDTYGLAARLGCASAAAAWEKNPIIESSVNPDDFRGVWL